METVGILSMLAFLYVCALFAGAFGWFGEGRIHIRLCSDWWSVYVAITGLFLSPRMACSCVFSEIGEAMMVVRPR